MFTVSPPLVGLKIQCTEQFGLNVGKVLTGRNGCFVNATELLKCHAYTECQLFAVLPTGIRPEGLLRITLLTNVTPSTAKADTSSPTPLGVNNTQYSHLDEGGGVGSPEDAVVTENKFPHASLGLQNPRPLLAQFPLLFHGLVYLVLRMLTLKSILIARSIVHRGLLMMVNWPLHRHLQ